jgi:hypothetical protein
VEHAAVTSDDLAIGLEPDQHAGEHDHERDRELKSRRVYDTARQNAHGTS